MVVPAAVILLVILLELRRWVQSRRREREMARALTRYLAQATSEQSKPGHGDSDGEGRSRSDSPR